MIAWARAMGCAGALLLAACPPSSDGRFTDYRALTDHFTMRISSDPLPPRARERVTFTLVVRDRESGQPVEGGEGRIYSNNSQGAGRTWDSFVPGPAPGTYTAKLYFITAENYAMGLQFRKDSTQKLEQVDWMQEVRPERSPTP